jgi:hypothetical protein
LGLACAAAVARLLLVARPTAFFHFHLEINKMANTDGDDDIATRLERSLLSIHRELDLIWTLHGMRGPERIDSGGPYVEVSRDGGGRWVIDRGAHR